jgi:hypothetical protein
MPYIIRVPIIGTGAMGAAFTSRSHQTPAHQTALLRLAVNRC